MNQILSIDNNQKGKRKQKPIRNKNSGPIEISNILKFFSIAILLFGIFMVGTGSYSMYKEVIEGESKTKPVIYVESTAETEILLRITHDKPLEKVTYKWNEEQENEVISNGKKEVETKIEIPEGTNALTVYAKDINGQDIEYRKVYTIDKNIKIEIEREGNELKITAKGKKELSYMTYRWDEDEEKRIDINSDEVEQTIEVLKGLHTLTVIVVDENNKTETVEEKINGVTPPELEVTTDGSSNFVIKASDEQGIKKIEFIINETEKFRIDLESILPIEERKQFEYTHPLEPGRNTIEVTVYNEYDVTETFKALVNL